MFISLSLQGQYHANRLRSPWLLAAQSSENKTWEMAANLAGDRASLLPPLTALDVPTKNLLTICGLWRSETLWWSPAGRLCLQKTRKCNRLVLVTLMVVKSVPNNHSPQKRKAAWWFEIKEKNPAAAWEKHAPIMTLSAHPQFKFKKKGRIVMSSVLSKTLGCYLLMDCPSL